MTTRSQSLIEQKKLQWSREREEMTKFCGLWGTTSYPFGQRKASNSYLLQLDKSQEAWDTDEFSINDSRCLPPIQKSIFNEYIRKDVKNAECNTSGYASETDTKDQFIEERKKPWKSQSNLHTEDFTSSVCSSGCVDDITNRVKWGDRGIGVGHLWEPTMNFDARLPEINNRPGTPHWLQKSLENKTHLRGPGLLAEPDVIIQREEKRLKALHFQESIRQQLLERERQRKEDKEYQLEEEKKLEHRVKKQQETELLRVEEEKRKQKIKEEKEHVKSKIMREALAAAEELAKEAKIKTKGKVLGDTQTNSVNHIISERLCDSQNTVMEDGIYNYSKGKPIITCDAYTSLTTEDYFEEFKSKIPLVTSSWTQTNTFCSPLKTRRKISKTNLERPKWGVNCPNIKYMKQSEKDLLYQRKYHSYHRHQSKQEQSGSSRSIDDSTDESKSASSSPHEKEFCENLGLILRRKFNQYCPKDRPNLCDLDGKTDEADKFCVEARDSTENIETKSNSLSRQDLLQELSCLSNELTMKKSYWENETSKLSSSTPSLVPLL